MSEFDEIAREGLIDMLQESQELIAALQEKVDELQSTNARLISAAAGRGMASEMDNPQEVAVLVCGLHDKIEKQTLVLKMYANRDNWHPYHNGTYILRTLSAPWLDAQEALRGSEDV